MRSLEDLTAVMLYNGDGGFKIDRNKPKSSGEVVLQGHREEMKTMDIFVKTC